MRQAMRHCFGRWRTATGLLRPHGRQRPRLQRQNTGPKGGPGAGLPTPPLRFRPEEEEAGGAGASVRRSASRNRKAAGKAIRLLAAGSRCQILQADSTLRA